ncbi:hypothetical protein BOSEA31B_11482 [Hyphomicrobiales bacterium]|nr:hypothetical protein BOSEA31B_11482 [Hyphomicrobiales bacterium]CAH1697278.1 hypothetical protein BOSEA1005_10315 [Hyphomicrobiales bacterium]CAI0342845.1 hypothetical protein BO1005MUT1_10138 [Hyphomicrobiales bacterium]
MSAAIPLQPDESLILVSAFARSLNAEYDQRCRVDDKDAKLDDLADLESEAVYFLANHSASTLAGLAAKASMLQARTSHLPVKGDLRKELSADDALSYSLLRDVIALAGVVPDKAPPDPAITCAQYYNRKFAAVNADEPKGGSPEHDKLVSDWDAAASLCYRTKPLSFAGCLALLEVIHSREQGCALGDETRVALETLRGGLAGLVNT